MMEIENRAKTIQSSSNSNKVTIDGDLTISDGARVSLENLSTLSSDAIIDVVAEQAAKLLTEIKEELSNSMTMPTIFEGSVDLSTESETNIQNLIYQRLIATCDNLNTSTNVNELNVNGFAEITGINSELVLKNESALTAACAIGSVVQQTADIQNTLDQQVSNETKSSSSMIIIVIIIIGIIVVIALFYFKPLYGVLAIVVLIAIIVLVVLLKQ